MTHEPSTKTPKKNGMFKNGVKYLGAAITSPKLIGSMVLTAAKSTVALVATAFPMVPIIVAKVIGVPMAAAFAYFVTWPALKMAGRGMERTNQVNSDVYRTAVGLPLKQHRDVYAVPKKGQGRDGFNESALKGDGVDTKTKQYEAFKSLRMKP